MSLVKIAPFAIVCLSLLLPWDLQAAAPDAPHGHSFALPSNEPSPSAFESALASGDEAPILRGQSPSTLPPGYGQPVPGYGQPVPGYGQPMPGYAPPPMQGYPGGAPLTNDPWLSGNPYAPSPVYPAQPRGPAYTFGVNGPAPIQYGMTERIDFTYMADADTSNPNVGSLGIFAFDFEKEFVKPIGNNWTFGLIPHLGIRSWDGPTNGGTSSLPGSAYSFGLGLKLNSPEVNGWSLELGFDPTLAWDFNSSISSKGVLYDGHAVAFWRANPQWMVALGIAYWDRVDDIILPYAGVVYTPNDLWEFRLLFPKPRISYFLGTPNGVATWVYVQAEYHVEAYQVDTFPVGAKDRVQLQDWRVVGGMRFEAGWLTTFVEAGYVFDRRVEFEQVGTNFDVDGSFIGRVGLRF